MDDEMLGGVSPTLQCKMREALRLVATAANQYTTCEKEQEGALVTVRTLKAAASDPDEAEVAAALKERTQMWERARAQRRKVRAYIEEKMGGGGKSPEEVIVFYASDSDVCEGSLVHQACASHSENEREDRGHSVPRNSGCVPDLEDICRCANGRE